MKRHESLAILSRQHHAALLLAQLLKKGAPPYRGMPTDNAGKVDYALGFYASDLIPHFAAEEAVLGTVQGIDSRLDELIGDIENEHVELRNLFDTLRNHPQLEEQMNTIGTTLDQHIRKEERQLFPLIEEVAGEEKLQEIMLLLTH